MRICSLWNLQVRYVFNIYKDVIWYFAGSIFGGHKDALLVFHKKMEEKCLEIIRTKNTIMWEINIWYLIYKKNKHLFITKKKIKCNGDKFNSIKIKIYEYKYIG